MTRETKIGLLVGLAFIIVIGILLSDQFTRQNEVPQANITVVGNKVREGTGIFQSNNPPGNAVAPNVTPDHQVPTVDEASRPHGGGVQEIAVGPRENGARPQHTSLQAVGERQNPRSREIDINLHGPASNDRAAGNATSPDNGNGNGNGNDDRAVVALPGDNLRRVARQAGLEIVEVPPRRGAENRYAATPTGSHGVAPRARADAADAQEVEAVAGDSLSRLASKFMGSSSKANRDAILRANPSLQQDPNKIIAGRKYVIPAAADEAASNDPAPPASAPRRPTAAASPEYFYVVQPGDSLIRIASEQLGDAKAYIAIKELNKDALKGGDIVIPNMKLRLPAKPVAMQ